MALQPYDDVFKCEFLLLQPLHLNLVRKVVQDQLLNPRIKRSMGSTQLAKLAFDPR